jgi:hypothetical protein
MLKALIIWLLLDVVALVMVLYEFCQWYGRKGRTRQHGPNTAETSKDNVPPFAA